METDKTALFCKGCGVRVDGTGGGHRCQGPFSATTPVPLLAKDEIRQAFALLKAKGVSPEIYAAMWDAANSERQFK